MDPDKLEVSITYVKADIANVLAFLSMASGVPIVVDGDVKGTVTITSVQKVPLTVAYDVINSALRVHGYTMVGNMKDKIVRVEPIKGMTDKPEVKVGNKAEDIGTSDTVITQVIPLQYLSATKLQAEIKAMVSDPTSLIAENSTNALILTDTEANVRHVVQLVNLLDKDTANVLDVEVYPCKFANAANLITSVMQVFGITNTTTTTTPTMPFGPGRFGPGGANQPATQPSTQYGSGNIELARPVASRRRRSAPTRL